MHAGIAIRCKKSGSKPGIGHNPVGMAETKMRRTSPDIPLIAENVLDGLKPQVILFSVRCLSCFNFIRRNVTPPELRFSLDACWLGVDGAPCASVLHKKHANRLANTNE